MAVNVVADQTESAVQERGFAPTVMLPPLPHAGDAADDLAGDGAPDVVPTIGHIGRYELKRCLGQGGLGTVHAAWDPILSRTVAVKTLQLAGDIGGRDALDALILNEARAAAGLSHPHIVTVYDAGRSEQGVYIAMERLRGRDLRQLLDEGWHPDPVQIALIVRRVADALAYAHAKGVIHCDVKPANIFMEGRTSPRVLDFGIARVAHGQAVAGFENLLAGSPHYLSPEQLRGQTPDRRSDVYSLGVVLYELLAGRKPFAGGTLAQIAQAVLAGHAPRADKVEPDVPAELARIAAKAMHPDPALRYRNARHLSQALRHWVETEGDNQADDEAEEVPVRRWPRFASGVLLGLVLGVALTTAVAAWRGAQALPLATLLR
ncbi:protein kinase family protein [Burkholderiales bacterium JOSHI_001]|nr:protein kinase family protein [Burkholderiales bacterium JOSHI_001]